MLSPLDDPGSGAGRGLTPTSGVGSTPAAAPSLPAFDGRSPEHAPSGPPAGTSGLPQQPQPQMYAARLEAPAAPQFDSAAQPLPTRHDSDSVRDLENKRVCPVSDTIFDRTLFLTVVVDDPQVVADNSQIVVVIAPVPPGKTRARQPAHRRAVRNG